MIRAHIEHRTSLMIAGEMIRRQYESDLKEKLKVKIRVVRSYLYGARKGYPEMDHWDCGRQDAYFDKVDNLFTEFEILKGAYELSKGSATRLKRNFLRAIGEQNKENK